ncbi:MAG: S24 family peptidase [Bacteroidia bacterium]
MQDKSLIKQNIFQVIENESITKAIFYKKTGITRGILDQNNGISEENIAKFLASYPNVNPSWLLTGKGNMFLDDNNVESLIKPINTTVNVITYNHSAAASNVNDVFDITYATGSINIDKSMGVREGDIGIYALGNSMEPRIYSGDLLICRKTDDSIDNLNPNEVYVIGTKNQLVVKILKKSKENPKTHVSLHSYNTAQHEPFDMDKKRVLYTLKVIKIFADA